MAARECAHSIVIAVGWHSRERGALRELLATTTQQRRFPLQKLRRSLVVQLATVRQISADALLLLHKAGTLPLADSLQTLQPEHAVSICAELRSLHCAGVLTSDHAAVGRLDTFLSAVASVTDNTPMARNLLVALCSPPTGGTAWTADAVAMSLVAKVAAQVASSRQDTHHMPTLITEAFLSAQEGASSATARFDPLEHLTPGDGSSNASGEVAFNAILNSLGRSRFCTLVCHVVRSGR